MEKFDRDHAAAVQQGCAEHKADIAQAFSVAFGAIFELEVGEPAAWADAKSAIAGPGLIIRYTVGAATAQLFIAQTTGLLPEWVANPPADQQARLRALAEDLSWLLFPSAFQGAPGEPRFVPDLAAALAAGGEAMDAGAQRLKLASDAGASGDAWFAWPFHAAEERAAHSGRPSEPPIDAASFAEDAAPAHGGIDSLPTYSRSLLRVKAPIMVRLASKKMAVGKIVELVPGALIQFNKPCDEMLDLEVCGQPFAKGECVKVGEKFGLRLTSMALPANRFATVQSGADR